ncbi:hypothetical protein [Aquirufa ecclesiirivi]|uniref:hypothetical protein n=1 Tax=Aquirufa ecclesiirivi TaxID=2715124 RepID=UPI0022A9ED50|nr:hypothetical protein [Aquirufa ecclesiirivi]
MPLTDRSPQSTMNKQEYSCCKKDQKCKNGCTQFGPNEEDMGYILVVRLPLGNAKLGNHPYESN